MIFLFQEKTSIQTNGSIIVNGTTIGNKNSLKNVYSKTYNHSLFFPELFKSIRFEISDAHLEVCFSDKNNFEFETNIKEDDLIISIRENELIIGLEPGCYSDIKFKGVINTSNKLEKISNVNSYVYISGFEFINTTISNMGTKDILIKNISGNNIKFKNTGTGDFVIENAKGQNITLENTGTGIIKGHNTRFLNIIMKNTGTGNISIN